MNGVSDPPPLNHAPPVDLLRRRICSFCVKSLGTNQGNSKIEGALEPVVFRLGAWLMSEKQTRLLSTYVRMPNLVVLGQIAWA